MEINLLKKYDSKYMITQGCKNSNTKLFYNYLYRLISDYEIIKELEYDFSKKNKYSGKELAVCWKLFDEYANNISKYISLVLYYFEDLKFKEQFERSVFYTKLNPLIKKLKAEALGEYEDIFIRYRNKFAAHHLKGEPKEVDYGFAQMFNSANPLYFDIELKRLFAEVPMHKKIRENDNNNEPKVYDVTNLKKISMTELHEYLIPVDINLDEIYNNIGWSETNL